MYDDPISAISREKELKKWKRTWKTKLIERRSAVDDSMIDMNLLRHSGMI